VTMSQQWQQYRRTQLSEMRPYEADEDLTGVSISEVDKNAGCPKLGDMIARNPNNHDDRWLVAEAYFNHNFEPAAAQTKTAGA
jgi:hypothetical protein